MGVRLLQGGTRTPEPRLFPREAFPNAANYYALCISILTGKSCDDACCEMMVGVKWKSAIRENKSLEYRRRLGEPAYILHKICGCYMTHTVRALHSDFAVIRDALAMLKASQGGRTNDNKE